VGYPEVVSLLVVPGRVVVVEVEVPLPGRRMVALVVPAAAMVVVAEAAVLHRAQELLGQVVMVLMVFLFSPTHRQVEHQNGSPTLIHNIQLQ